MWHFLFVAAWLSSISGQVYAQSLKDALKSFGLIGTWSFNCANDFAIRFSIQAPIFGPPTFTGGGN
jgi:hypothetical protein